MQQRHERRIDSPPAAPRPLPDGSLYFIGVGGAGMSALAQVLAERGGDVRGADSGISPAVRARLEASGATVYGAHRAENVRGVAGVVVSDAIPEDNPELAAARDAGLAIFRRPEALGALADAGRGIAIAGTHGKTTTTGMTAQILLAADLDPTVFLGGDLPALAGNARAGRGPWVLAEACEAYDGFLYLHPQVAVVLNVEADHLDYHGTEAHVIASFVRFVGQVKPGGTVILCGDDPKARALSGAVAAPEQTLVLYGLDDAAAMAVTARDLDPAGPRPSFTLVRHGRAEGRVTLGVPGRHNVLNALAAAAVGFAVGVPSDRIVAGLEAFTGTGRRFETMGEAAGVRIIDDYAHHPTELRATLAAARGAFPGRRIVAVFQPHLPSRTRDLMDEFAAALAAGADRVYLCDIYLAREAPLAGISSGVLADRVAARGASAAVAYVPDKNDLAARLARDVRAGDVVLTLGAGDIRTVAVELRERLSSDDAG
jgi:UDP-N-acetylmuramate--alanine ligase